MSTTVPDLIDKDKLITFECGAKSSEEMLRFDKIPVGALRAEALRFTQGGMKYDPSEGKYLGGVQNWQTGDAEFYRDRANHALNHLLTWIEDYQQGRAHAEDHLSAVRWACAVLAWAEEKGRIHPGKGWTP